MPGTFGGFPFDEEIFNRTWQSVPDLVSTALLTSGAMVEDSAIASQIAGGSNTYTTPFYGLLAQNAPENYDGATDIKTDTLSGTSESGVVFGRMHGWSADQFVGDFGTGVNPMGAIAGKVAGYWSHYRQNTIISILEAVLGVSGMSTHTVTAASLTATTVSDAACSIYGQHKDQLALAIMHSNVAQAFEDMERVEYLKQTDANGIQRALPIYQVNGLTVIVDDGVGGTAAVTDPSTGNVTTPATYNTYLLANGSLRHASAPVTQPVELFRDPKTRGGVDMLFTRERETIHPNGFSYKLPASCVSPTDAQLAAKGNWSLVADAAAVPIAKLITPGFAV